MKLDVDGLFVKYQGKVVAEIKPTANLGLLRDLKAFLESYDDREIDDIIYDEKLDLLAELRGKILDAAKDAEQISVNLVVDTIDKIEEEMQ